MKYRFMQDDDCHWYLIPADKHQEFGDWVYGDEGVVAGTPQPEWAEMLSGSPSEYNFAAPVLDWRLV